MRSLQDISAADSKVDQVKEALDRFEQLSRRVAVYERLRGQADMLQLPTLPLQLVLDEPSSTVLLCLASLPQGSASLIGPVLQSFEWLRRESAPVRLAVVGQLLTGAGGSRDGYASLAASGTAGWLEGRQGVERLGQLRGGQVVDARGVGRVLQGHSGDGEGDEVGSGSRGLLDVLSKELQGQMRNTFLLSFDETHFEDRWPTKNLSPEQASKLRAINALTSPRSRV